MPEVEDERWRTRAYDYAARVEGFVGPHPKRAQVNEAHPVWDFLFSYYLLRHSRQRCWHPGYVVALPITERAAVVMQALWERCRDLLAAAAQGQP